MERYDNWTHNGSSRYRNVPKNIECENRSRLPYRIADPICDLETQLPYYQSEIFQSKVCARLRCADGQEAILDGVENKFYCDLVQRRPSGTRCAYLFSKAGTRYSTFYGSTTVRPAAVFWQQPKHVQVCSTVLTGPVTPSKNRWRIVSLLNNSLISPPRFYNFPSALLSEENASRCATVAGPRTLVPETASSQRAERMEKGGRNCYGDCVHAL